MNIMSVQKSREPLKMPKSRFAAEAKGKIRE
jgi:hypothetical protein